MRHCVVIVLSINFAPFLAAIAQLVEQLTCNEKVQGSTPCGGTTLIGQSLGVGSEDPRRLVRLVVKREWKRFRCKARIGLIQS